MSVLVQGKRYCVVDKFEPLAEQLTVGNLLLTIIFVRCIVLLLKKFLNDLPRTVQRYSFYVRFYGLMIAALITRMFFFFTVFLIYEGAIPQTSVPISDILYNLFINLPNIFFLILTMMVCYTWYMLIVKVKYTEGVSQKLLSVFRRVSAIIFGILLIVYTVFSIMEMTVTDVEGDREFVGLISYFGNEATVVAIHFVILVYLAYFGSKMIHLLKEIDIIQEQRASQQRRYRLNLYTIIILAACNVIYYTIQITIFAASEDVKSFSRAACQFSPVLSILLVILDYGILELWPLMIYQQFLIPVEDDSTSVGNTVVQKDDEEFFNSRLERRRSSGEMISSAQQALALVRNLQSQDSYQQDDQQINSFQNNDQQSFRRINNASENAHDSYLDSNTE